MANVLSILAIVRMYFRFFYVDGFVYVNYPPPGTRFSACFLAESSYVGTIEVIVPIAASTARPSSPFFSSPPS